MSPLHLYALVREGDEPAELGRGLAGVPVRVVRAGGLVAVASETAASPEVDLAALRSHDAVVRQVAATTRAHLPMRFGQLVADEPTLGELVERSLPRLRTTLAAVEGCEQTTWRVFAPDGRAPSPPGVPSDPEDDGPPPSLEGLGPGARYLHDLAARRRVESTPPRTLAPVLARVAPFVRAERLESHDSPPLLTSVHHLVRVADRRAYRELLDDALACVDGVRIRVGDAGPPYAFVGGWGS